MNRSALKPLPRHEDLAEMAMMMLRSEPESSLSKQTHDVNTPMQIAVEDWDRLFQAVEYRLSTSVAAVDPIADKTRVTVLECVEALDQLHNALTRERLQRHQSL